MPPNLKKLQAFARRRLNLKGRIQLRAVSAPKKSSFLLLETSPSSKDPSEGTHTISYADVSSLGPRDIYHELCKAKLYELGFTTIENASLNAMRDCSKDDPKYIRDATSAETIVLETYANCLLLRVFPETQEQLNQTISRFESSDALTGLRTQLGFWGVAAVSYHREASRRAGTHFPTQIVERAMERALNGNEMKSEYDAINSRLRELPDLPLVEATTDKKEEERAMISDDDGLKIVEIIVGLFSDKTGLDC